MADNRGLVKVEIQAYDDRNYEQPMVANFFIPINPETYAQNFQVKVNSQQAHGKSVTDPKFISQAPEELKLEFILDGTQTMEGYGQDLFKEPVKTQLQKFRDCVYNYDGTIHRPRFLKVFWGKELTFPCVLTNLDLNYTLFNPDGSPLRVKINATFLNYVAQLKREAQERNSSPDLTHHVKADSSNRLDLMTYKIYNDSKYFIQIGKINNLTSLRTLPVGKELSFPPFNKNET